MKWRPRTGTRQQLASGLVLAVLLLVALPGSIGASFVGMRFASTTAMATTGATATATTTTATTGGNVNATTSPSAATRATRIQIARLSIDMPIRAGVIGAPISVRYAYHYPTTSWPGGGSNIYLYAHAQTGAFLNLKYARRGDLVVMRLVNGTSVKYRVTGVYTVAWNAGKWVFPTSSEQLTLQTCLGATQTAPRLIVIAVPTS